MSRRIACQSEDLLPDPWVLDVHRVNGNSEQRVLTGEAIERAVPGEARHASPAASHTPHERLRMGDLSRLKVCHRGEPRRVGNSQLPQRRLAAFAEQPGWGDEAGRIEPALAKLPARLLHQRGRGVLIDVEELALIRGVNPRR